MAARPPASKCLTYGVTSTPGYDDIYTVPGGVTTILKSVLIMQHSAGSFVADINCLAVPGPAIPVYHIALSQYATLNQATWVVLHGGWKIQLRIDAGGLWSYWLSGAELEGTPAHPTVPGLLVPDPSEMHTPEEHARSSVTALGTQ